MSEELTDREKETQIYKRVALHKELALDGWSRIHQGAAAFSKEGKYLDINGEKVAAPKPAKVEPKVVEPDEAA